MPQAGCAPSTKSRLAEELREYLILSLYLYVCLGAILLYRTALMDDHGIGGLHVGTAVVKALVLAKFAMLGRIAGVGTVSATRPLLHAVFRGSLAMLFVLAGLTLVEDVVIGTLHGGKPEGVLVEIASGRWSELGAGVLLMWLVLIPYLAFQYLLTVLGKERTRHLLLGG